MASRVAGVTWPFWASFETSWSTGLPGMSRGIRKFRVSAAHRATA
jgi:hypothetical protein